MVDDEKEAAPIEDGKARWPRIFQKKLTDTTQFVKVCTLPSETQYWKMYLIGSGGNPPASFFVKVAYTDNPGEDEWFPLKWCCYVHFQKGFLYLERFELYRSSGFH